MRAAFGRPTMILLAVLVLAVTAWAAGLSLPQDRGPATLEAAPAGRSTDSPIRPAATTPRRVWPTTPRLTGGAGRP